MENVRESDGTERELTEEPAGQPVTPGQPVQQPPDEPAPNAQPVEPAQPAEPAEDPGQVGQDPDPAEEPVDPEPVQEGEGFQRGDTPTSPYGETPEFEADNEE